MIASFFQNISQETVDLILFCGQIYVALYLLFLPLLIKEGKDCKDKNTEPDECSDDPFTVPKQKTNNGINKSSD
jgi:hypothetical protein